MLPLYYRETFFAKDSLLHPEVSSAAYGMAGAPIPYTLSNDNFVTALLLLCFVLTLVFFGHFRPYAARQYKMLFMRQRSEGDMPTETTGELRLKSLFLIQTCLLFSIVMYFCVRVFMPGPLTIESDYLLVLIFMAVLIGYTLLKGACYTMVNITFFDGKRNGQFLSSIMLVLAMEGLLLFPVVLLLVYFDLSVQNVLYYFVIVVFLGKILTFYKSFSIFFRQNGGFLQNILYFCALEIVPFVALVGVSVALVDFLKINF